MSDKEILEMRGNQRLEMMTALSKYKRVITNIHEDMIENLDVKEKAFYEACNHKKKDRFLYMARDDRAALMASEDKKEQDKYWEVASTLSLHYINKPYMLSDVMGKLAPYARMAFIAAAVCVCADIFFNTYAKNRQLHAERLDGVPKYELIPAVLPKFNNDKQNISTSTTIMSLSDYTKYITQKNFACGELKAITDSWYQPSGKPLCKATPGGDVFVAGYVNNPTFPQPILNVIHKGAIYNFDMSNDAAITTAALPGYPSVTFRRIPFTFQAAFPEAVRVAEANVVTKNREGKE